MGIGGQCSNTRSHGGSVSKGHVRMLTLRSAASMASFHALKAVEIHACFHFRSTLLTVFS